MAGGFNPRLDSETARYSVASGCRSFRQYALEKRQEEVGT